MNSIVIFQDTSDKTFAFRYNLNSINNRQLCHDTKYSTVKIITSCQAKTKELMKQLHFLNDVPITVSFNLTIHSQSVTSLIKITLNTFASVSYNGKTTMYTCTAALHIFMVKFLTLTCQVTTSHRYNKHCINRILTRGSN